MATAVSEPQQNAVQSIESNKLSSQQIMHNGGSGSGTDPKCSSNVKDPQRVFGMSTHQFTPDSGNSTDQNPPSPKEPNDSKSSEFDDLGHRPPYPPNKLLVRPVGPSMQPSMHPSMYPSQPQQQYLSGHRISQQSGPTPTLNQLLQTSNTIRMPNSVPASTPSPYPQNWQHQAQNPLYPHQPPNTPNSTNTQQIYGNPASPFVHRPPQSSTPNTNIADSVDLAGQNSNDSFSGVGGAGGGGGAPGTPNSQGMRPSPSPTGSTGSRSMSPAVGQQNIQMPPRPSSSQSDGSGPTRMSHSPMAAQGGYQQGPPPPPHIAGYKISGSGPPPQGPSTGSPGAPAYTGGPQPAQGNYGAVRAPGQMQYSPNQIYGAPNNPGTNTNNINAGQYPGRPMPNHFPGYQGQAWNAPSNQGGASTPLSPGPGGGGGNKGTPPVSQPQPSSSPLLHGGSNSQSPRPPHYLKTHLQHKMGFGTSASPGPPGSMTSHSPPQGYPGMGPPNVGGMHHSMGPPTMGTHGHMGPPNNSYDGPMPPPSSTPNSQMPVGSDSGGGDCSNVDNGITTTAASNVGTHVTPSGTPSVTSVVTTGPDGTTIDEGSQQSTLSNASIASGEDPQCSTPKSRKNDLSGGTGGHYSSHPATPQSTVPSPGAASMNSMHADEYDISSPTWPRTPASPVFNSHVSQPETYRSKKSDSLSKLYEMDDSPDRRTWLDKLLGFMEERRTPITTCPTISKNPLDLFRLYLYVKERGGFMEVCKVTKNKTWKDIAGMLGIGASSSAAYTLRRHYTKNLLPYECKFDRGGIDPQPIINQVEGTTKKKGVKATSIPSPGSSNSQDSFPAPGSSGASLDGYSGYGYPPSSQTNAPSPHPSGAGQSNVLNHQQGGNSATTGDNISVSNPFDDGASGQAPRYGAGPPGPPQHGPSGGPPFVAAGSPRPQMPQGYSGQPGYNQYPGSGTSPDPYQTYPNNSNYSPSSRGINYPPYSPDTERSGYPPSSSMPTNLPPTNTNSSGSGTTPGPDPYNRYTINTSTGPGPAQSFPRQPGYGMNTNPPSSQPNAPTPPGGSYTQQSEYYRNDGQNYPGGGAPSQTPPGGGTGNQVYGNGKAMPPPTTQPRRHPDFAKDPQYPYNPPKPPMYGWPNNQYRGQYTGPPGPTSGPPTGQWPQGNVPPRGPVPGPPGANVPSTTNAGSWPPDHRYSGGSTSNTGATSYPPSQSGQPQWNNMPPSPNVGPNTGLRPSMMGPRAPYRPEGKPPFNMPPPQVLNKSSPAPGGMTTSYTQQPLPKREITFPPDSVEAAGPCFYRRKRLTRSDVAPLDAWRIVMSLRSGLLSETTWALDVLNVLLFDDSAIAYFGLGHLPGLLDILLEHFQRSLSDMFESTENTSSTGADSTKEWYEAPRKKIESVDLGGVTSRIDANDHQTLLTNTPNYNAVTRKGATIKVIPKDDEIFILDNHREWDPERNSNERCLLAEGQFNFESWQVSCTNNGYGYNPELTPTDHILRCFQAEFGNVPFVKLLRSKEEGGIKIKEESDQSENSKRIKVECSEEEQEEEEEVVEEEDNLKDDKVVVKEDIKLTTKQEVVLESNKNRISVNDLAGVLKRRRMSDFEDEPFSRDDPSLCLITESQESLGRRCICISTILRNLTFIPGNELEFARNPTFLALLGKLLSLHHEHPVRTQKTRNYDREEDADFADSCSSLQGETFWWWDYLMQVRENVLVAIANIAGHIDLEPYDEQIARPILDGLLHWAICPSAHGQDPFPNNGPYSMLSPQRLALESLCKLCVTDANVDLVIATPPFSRLQRLCSVLTKLLCRLEEQVLREFAVNLLHYLSAASSAMARSIALQSPCVSLLVSFIEQAETSALSIANQHGIGALRENPDAMGTSLDMLRRAAHTLLNLAKHSENRPLFIQQEQRLLSLAMSQILDQQVANIISSVLFECSIPYNRTLLS